MAYKLAFRAYSAIRDTFFYAHSANVDSFMIVSFLLRNITFRSKGHCFGQGDCYFGYVKTVQPTCNTRTLRFSIPCICSYLDSPDKFGFRA